MMFEPTKFIRVFNMLVDSFSQFTKCIVHQNIIINISFDISQNSINFLKSLQKKLNLFTDYYLRICTRR